MVDVVVMVTVVVTTAMTMMVMAITTVLPSHAGQLDQNFLEGTLCVSTHTEEPLLPREGLFPFDLFVVLLLWGLARKF